MLGKKAVKKRGRMGFFGKIFSRRKGGDFDVGKEFGKDLGLGKDFGIETGMSPDLGLGLEPQQSQYPPYPQQPQQVSQPQGFQPPYQPQPQYTQYTEQSYVNAKNLEVISSKLDALKASLDSISQRLANLEAIARGEQEINRKRYY